VVHAPDRTVADRQKAQLDSLRAERDSAETTRHLTRLRIAAEGTDNLMPVLIDCARADASLGEMVNTLRGVFGEFEEPAI
jgi:methylmalonyl-CoA mutase N-terminal domain/subunit